MTFSVLVLRRGGEVFGRSQFGAQEEITASDRGYRVAVGDTVIEIPFSSVLYAEIKEETPAPKRKK